MDFVLIKLNKNVTHPHFQTESEDGMKFIKLTFKSQCIYDNFLLNKFVFSLYLSLIYFNIHLILIGVN
jgi:hypothetical protein